MACCGTCVVVAGAGTRDACGEGGWILEGERLGCAAAAGGERGGKWYHSIVDAILAVGCGAPSRPTSKHRLPLRPPPSANSPTTTHTHALDSPISHLPAHCTQHPQFALNSPTSAGAPLSRPWGGHLFQATDTSPLLQHNHILQHNNSSAIPPAARGACGPAPGRRTPAHAAAAARAPCCRARRCPAAARRPGTARRCWRA